MTDSRTPRHGRGGGLAGKGHVADFKSVARGGGTIFTGSLAATALDFAGGIVVVRCLSRSEYGLFALAFVWVRLVSMVAMLGLGSGTPQVLSRRLAGGEHREAWGVVLAAGSVVFTTSVVLGLGLHRGSRWIAIWFDKPDLAPAIALLAVALPALALLQIGAAIFRGLQESLPKVVFGDLAPKLLRIGGLVVLLLVGVSLRGVIWVTVLSLYAGVTLLLVYSVRRLPVLLGPARPHWRVSELLTFSAPLLGLSIINIALLQVGTVLMGYFAATDVVALYSAPQRLKGFVELPLAAMIFIYLPVATRLARQGQTEDLRALYLSTTKWIALASLPIVLVMVLDARFLVGAVFGEQYLPAAPVLQILVVGSFVHAFLGPNGMTLLGMGHRRALVVSPLIGVAVNVLLSIALIPSMGAMGGALAAAGALVCSNVGVSLVLFQKTGIHPLHHRHLGLVLTPAVAGILIYRLLGVSESSAIAVHAIGVLFLLAVCFFTPFILRHVDDTDLALLEAVERRVRGRVGIASKLAALCRCPVQRERSV